MSGTTRSFKEKMQREDSIRELVAAAFAVLRLVDHDVIPNSGERDRLREAIEVLK